MNVAPMTTRKNSAGTSLLTYTLGIGVSIMAFLLIVSTVNSGPITALLMDTNQPTPSSIKSPSTTLTTLKEFSPTVFKNALEGRTLECLSKSKVCIPVYPHQNRLEQGTLERLESLRAEIHNNTRSTELNRLFREFAEHIQELAILQKKLARAIEDRDSIRSRELITQINGGTQAYINRSCLPEASFCITESQQLSYNMVLTHDSFSTIAQLKALQKEISTHPEILSIENASSVLDSIFAPLEQRTQSMSLLVSGTPVFSSAYSKTEIQDILSTLAGNSSYVKSLTAFQKRNKSAQAHAQNLVQKIQSSETFSNSPHPTIDLIVNQLIQAMATRLMKDSKVTAKLKSGSPAQNEAFQVVLNTFKDTSQTTTSNHEIFVLQKIRSEFIWKTETGQALLQSAMSEAKSRISFAQLKQELISDGDRPELVIMVIQVTSQNPRLIANIETLTTSSATNQRIQKSTARALIKAITETESKEASQHSLTQTAETLDKASQIHCHTGQGQIEGPNCRG